MKRIIIAGTLVAALAACGSVPQNPLADAGQITTNPTTGQASAEQLPPVAGPIRSLYLRVRLGCSMVLTTPMP